MEIRTVTVIKKVGDRIKVIRINKNLTQANMAEELEMTTSAYSKIERSGVNTPLKRLFQIAEILEVKITEFFEDKVLQTKENKSNYGYATKAELAEVTHALQSLTKVIENLKEDMHKKARLKKKYESKKKPG